MLLKLGERVGRALRPDAQAFDEVRIVTVPRYKTSGLSGDGWRISAKIEFYRKGKLIRDVDRFSNIETACGFAYSAYHAAIGNGDAYFAGEGDTCDQEGCAEMATVTYRLKREFCSCGHEKEPLGIDIRKFCDKHKRRGDQSLDDCDENYEVFEEARLEN